MNYYEEENIKICKNCHGVEPCHCDKPDYAIMAKWVYDLMKRLNPMG